MDRFNYFWKVMTGKNLNYFAVRETRFRHNGDQIEGPPFKRVLAPQLKAPFQRGLCPSIEGPLSKGPRSQLASPFKGALAPQLGSYDAERLQSLGRLYA